MPIRNYSYLAMAALVGLCLLGLVYVLAERRTEAGPLSPAVLPTTGTSTYLVKELARNL